MKRYLKFKNYTILETPSKVRVRYTLSNGQVLSVFFTRKRAKNEGFYPIRFVWTIAVYIGSNRQEANDWYTHSNKHTKQTGKVGLEGLKVASDFIQMFAYNFCGYRDELQIAGTDKKRQRAYEYLLRYNGFANYGDRIAFRHPDFYEWIGESA